MKQVKAGLEASGWRCELNLSFCLKKKAIEKVHFSVLESKYLGVQNILATPKLRGKEILSGAASICKYLIQ